jgi:DNA-binding NtrC family response regulator
MSLEKILVIGRDENVQELARTHTKQLFAAEDTSEIWEILKSVEPEAIFFDTKTHQQEIGDFLSSLNDRQIEIPVVIVASKSNLPNEDQLNVLGAFDIIKGKKDHKRIPEIIERIKEPEGSLQINEEFFIPDCPRSVSIAGKSDATQQSLKMIRIVAMSSCNPVLIVGETGTGKELAAKAVHTIRHGSNRSFVAVNCAALTANLLESELFGHVKGSFTSADKEKTGLLEIAQNGTIFLDEISEMPLELQAKLLRVLQEKTFRKVGGTQTLKCEATIIASSNMDLSKAVKENKFRRDLYYRLAICPIKLAPLRTSSRKDDILLLARYFIQKSGICPEKRGAIKGLTKLAAEALLNHHWPGNIRELKNVIDRAILLENTDKIGLSNIMFDKEQFEETPANTAVASIKDFSLEKAEKELIAKALNEAGWQKTKAASMLGITRATLYAKVKQYKIKEPSSKPQAVMT